MDNAYTLQFLFQNQYTTKDKNADTIIKNTYKTIKDYIKEVKVNKTSRVYVILKDRVNLRGYRTTVKEKVTKALNDMVVEASKIKSPNVKIGAYIEGTFSFNVGNVGVSVSHSIVDPKRVQRLQITQLRSCFKKLHSNIISGDEFKVSIGNVEYIMKDYDDLSIVELPTDSSSNRTETKADCIINTKKNNIKIYLSLKGNAFRQWGGISVFSTHPEVSKFVGDVKQQKKPISPSSNTEYTRKVVDEELKSKAIFGKNYGNAQSQFGVENVNHVIIGDTITIKPGNEISSRKIYTNRNLNLRLDDKHIPYLLAKYDATRNDAGLSNTRISIWPGKRTQAIEI